MAVRHLYIARHGDADPFGEITSTGRAQARLLGERLAHLPIDAVWHSPLPRAAVSARILSAQLPDGVPVCEAPELVDHVPFVPSIEEIPTPHIPFFDGYDPADAEAGHRTAQSLVSRFATVPSDTGDPANTGDPSTVGGPSDTDDVHEVLVTHAYPIAWLVRDALRAPAAAWLGLESANTALTVLEYRPSLPPTLVMFNDMTHLPPVLRWSGFTETVRP